jgi:AraC family transcriptional regulator
MEYIEASLAESVSLADIASAAGLTRMHFAARFKTATGLRPHEYLLRSRIERAQEKLAGTGMSRVEVALSVGFQTQSHFTSVFKGMVGQPPRAWRQSHGNPSPPCVSITRRASWRGCSGAASLGLRPYPYASAAHRLA